MATFALWLDMLRLCGLLLMAGAVAALSPLKEDIAQSLDGRVRH